MQEKNMYQKLYQEAVQNLSYLEQQLKLQTELLEEVRQEMDWLERELVEKNGQIAAYQYALKLYAESGKGEVIACSRKI